jgi:hypothetical protein
VIHNETHIIERKWLEDLSLSISEIRRSEVTLNMSGDSYNQPYRVRLRKLTEDEFKRFLEIAPHFIVEPGNAQFGFNFGLALYDFPSKDGAKPEFIFFVSGEYLPDGMDDKFEGAWKAFSSLSHSLENEKLLSLCGLGTPREKIHYEY